MFDKIQGIVLIADTANFNTKISLSSNNLEMTDLEQLSILKSALKKLSLNIYHYSDPKSFTQNLNLHKDHFIFTLWSGQKSRNRRAIIPAICEGNGIKYLGGDPYVALICQDKPLTKAIINRFELETPEHIIYPIVIDNSISEHINYPVVVKPTLEGGSIGISSDNIATSPAHALKIATKLYELYSQPILIEEFIYGSEVSICITGNNSEIHFIEVIEVLFEDSPEYLFNRLYSFEEKKREVLKAQKRLKILLNSFQKKFLIEP